MATSKTPDPRNTARTLYAENLRLRELLATVAGDLELLGAEGSEAPHRDRLLARAMRIRERLHG